MMRKSRAPTSYRSKPRKVWVSISPTDIVLVDVRHVVHVGSGRKAVRGVGCGTHSGVAWQ